MRLAIWPWSKIGMTALKIVGLWALAVMGVGLLGAVTDGLTHGADWVIIPVGLAFAVWESTKEIPAAVVFFFIGLWVFGRVGSDIQAAINRQTDALVQLIERIDSRLDE